MPFKIFPAVLPVIDLHDPFSGSGVPTTVGAANRLWTVVGTWNQTSGYLTTSTPGNNYHVTTDAYSNNGRISINLGSSEQGKIIYRMEGAINYWQLRYQLSTSTSSGPSHCHGVFGSSYDWQGNAGPSHTHTYKDQYCGFSGSVTINHSHSGYNYHSHQRTNQYTHSHTFTSSTHYLYLERILNGTPVDQTFSTISGAPNSLQIELTDDLMRGFINGSTSATVSRSDFDFMEATRHGVGATGTNAQIGDFYYYAP